MFVDNSSAVPGVVATIEAPYLDKVHYNLPVSVLSLIGSRLTLLDLTQSHDEVMCIYLLSFARSANFVNVCHFGIKRQ